MMCMVLLREGKPPEFHGPEDFPTVLASESFDIGISDGHFRSSSPVTVFWGLRGCRELETRGEVVSMSFPLGSLVKVFLPGVQVLLERVGPDEKFRLQPDGVVLEDPDDSYSG